MIWPFTFFSKKTYEQLGVPDHGLYRQSTQAVHGGPAQVTSSTNAGTSGQALTSLSQQGTLAYYAAQQATQQATQQGITQMAGQHYSGGIGGISTAAWAIGAGGGGVLMPSGIPGWVSASVGGFQPMAGWAWASTNIPTIITPEQAYKDIKYDGIRAGEIIAYRCWPLQNGFLWSTAAGRAWAPNETMSAQEKHLETGLGVYSFKNMSKVIESFGNPAERWSHGTFLAFGTVELWGEIIEHEIGYRAEHAKVRSIEFVVVSSVEGGVKYSEDKCTELRCLYGLEDKS